MKLTLKEFAEAKGFTEGDLEKFGVRPGQGGIVIPYFDAQGNEYIKQRIRTETEDGKGFRWSRGEADLIPYGLSRPVPYSKGFVWIVEGESDCWALWLAGIPALGLPGAASAKPLDVKYLDGVTKVAVVQEPGTAGDRFPHVVATKLYDQGFEGLVYAVELGEGKDPRCLMKSDPENFRKNLAEVYSRKRLIERPRALSPATSTTSQSMADLFDEPAEEVEWLVDGLLPRDGIALLAAKPKAGKSVLARNMALAIARGGKFLGRQCRAGVVLWVAFEERKADVLADFKMLGADRTDPIRFHFGASPTEAVAWLKAECKAHQVAFLVLDTWHKFAMIENINDYAQVNRANEPLMRLASEHGIAQCWVHHTNKGISVGGSEVLGSSALFAACDSLIVYDRAADGTRTLKSIQRRGDDLEPTVVAIDENKRVSIAGSKFSIDTSKAEQRILDVLSDEPRLPDDIRAASEVRRGVFWSALNALIREGLVEKTGSGKRGDQFHYRGVAGPGGLSPLNRASQPSTVPQFFSQYKEGLNSLVDQNRPGVVGTTGDDLGTDGTDGTEMDTEGWSVQVGVPENDPFLEEKRG